MVKYGYRNYLTSNTLYNSQVGAIIFCCGIVFKVSSLPGIVASEMASSTLWAYLIMTAAELMLLACWCALMKQDADAHFTECGSKIYRVLCGIASLYLSAKAVMYFAYTALFLTNELFSGLAPFIVLVVFLIPIVYAGVKGARTIARSAEIAFLLLFFGIMINLVFLDANMDFGRNMPFLSAPPETLAKNLFSYGLWLGDMLPLVFIKVKSKKLPYIAISAGVSAVIVNIVVMLGIAMYGDALQLVSNMLLRLSTFSQLSLQIGRMEWISLFVLIVMAMFALSFLYWGAAEACKRAVGSAAPIRFLLPAAMLAVVAAVPESTKTVEFAHAEFGYAMFASAVFMPVLFLAAYAHEKKRHPDIFAAAPDAYSRDGAANSDTAQNGGARKEAGNEA